MCLCSSGWLRLVGTLHRLVADDCGTIARELCRSRPDKKSESREKWKANKIDELLCARRKIDRGANACVRGSVLWAKYSSKYSFGVFLWHISLSYWKIHSAYIHWENDFKLIRKLFCCTRETRDVWWRDGSRTGQLRRASYEIRRRRRLIPNQPVGEGNTKRIVHWIIIITDSSAIVLEFAHSQSPRFFFTDSAGLVSLPAFLCYWLNGIAERSSEQ